MEVRTEWRVTKRLRFEHGQPELTLFRNLFELFLPWTAPFGNSGLASLIPERVFYDVGSQLQPVPLLYHVPQPLRLLAVNGIVQYFVHLLPQSLKR